MGVVFPENIIVSPSPPPKKQDHIKALTCMLLGTLVADAMAKSGLYLHNRDDKRGSEQSVPVLIFKCCEL